MGGIHIWEGCPWTNSSMKQIMGLCLCTSLSIYYSSLTYWVVALSHAIYLKLTPLLRARRKTESHVIAKTHTTNSKSQWARLIQHIHWHHQILTKPGPHCVKQKETQSNSHTANSKSQWARLIQHIHWHHQVLTKPCAHCVEHQENSHQWQQITLCTGHSSQHGKFKRRRNQNEMLNEIGTRWERDPGSASGNFSLFFCPNHKSLVKTRCFTACLKSRAPVSVFF